MNNNYPKDVFMHLLAILALYVGAYSLMALLFQYVNVFLPDPLNPYYDAGGAIRWALSSLIIIFPVFLWSSRYLYKDRTTNPEKSEYRIRKWLLYFTLFVAGLLVIGDLVAVVYNFLNGELTLRFLLKAFSILAVAAAIFFYYLYDLRRAPGEFSFRAKLFVQSSVIVIVIVIVGGFFIAGSPAKQRLVRFDSQKVNDLQSIQSSVVNYWIQKERLPQSADDLRDNISGYIPPKDPQTGNEYEYIVTGDLAFELCADFNFSSGDFVASKPVYPYGPGETWDHESGRVCFSRIIDPELYSKRLF